MKKKFNRFIPATTFLMLALLFIIVVFSLFESHYYLESRLHSEKVDLAKTSIADSAAALSKFISEDGENFIEQKEFKADLLATLKEIKRSAELISELKEVENEAEKSSDKSLLMRMLTTGGLIIISILGFVLACIGFVTNMFFKDLQEKTKNEVKDRVKATFKSNIRLASMNVKLEIAKANNSRGYVNYKSFEHILDKSNPKQNNDIAMTMLEQAIHVTVLAFRSLMDLKDKNDNVSIEDEFQSSEDREEYQKLLEGVHVTYIWSRYNLCYYLAKARETGLIDEHGNVYNEDFDTYVTFQFLREQLGASNFSNMIHKLRFDKKEELDELEPHFIDRHEIVDSALFCEYSFYQNDILRNKSYAMDFKERVKKLLEANEVILSNAWDNKKLFWWDIIADIDEFLETA
ncbi:MAG: hypothetical protein ACRBB4_15730 [Neptuniibacter sp.]